MGWDEQAEKCCEILAQLDKLFQEADDLHSESDAELSQRTEGSEPANRVWWAQLLLDHTHKLGIRIPKCELPRRVVSCCSGGCSEAFALKELDIPFIIESSSEPERQFREFQLANHVDIQHQHVSFADQLAAAPCALHSGSSECKVEASPDLLVIGAPCNPFSIQRPGRFTAGSTEGHALSKLTLRGVLTALQKFSPHTAIAETTDGFLKPLSADSSETPLTLHHV
ncbi:unnamed protein product [Symbiodinium sp. CCMP2592]|nr:unnamed protein product [Symbiodinium sp. CCMP2592]